MRFRCHDAAFLIANGYDVTAIEASLKMIDVAQHLHPELAGRFIRASVPLRDSDSLFSRQFGAVVCIGTIIHIPTNIFLSSLPRYGISLRQMASCSCQAQSATCLHKKTRMNKVV